MTDETKPQTDGQQPEESYPSWRRLPGIFLEPSRTFQEINRRPNWVLPVLVLIGIVLLTNYYVINTIGYETIARQQRLQSSQIQQLSEEQREDVCRTRFPCF